MTIGNRNETHKNPQYWWIFFVCVPILLLFFVNRFPSTRDIQLVGKLAPDIEFTGIDGQHASIVRMRGNVILVNFWASWCAPCMDEMPALKHIEGVFADRPFKVLAFNVEETEEDVRNKLNLETFPRGLVFNFAAVALRSYAISTIPKTFIIDKRGIVANVFLGPKDWGDRSSIKTIEEHLRD